MTEQIFLLSPARCSGQRAAMLMNRGAQFPLARALRSTEGATIGQTFSFLTMSKA